MSNTTLAELRRRVLLGMPFEQKGELLLSVDQAVNDALRAIATVRDFDDLIVTDTTHAATVDGQKTYHWVTHWGLTRPKKIYSIRCMDTTSSRKLEYVSANELDKVLPYAEQLSEGLPTHYTDAGSGNFELLRIPDAAYSLYIRYSQWPNTLANETDETPYSNLDMQTIFLAKDITNAYLHGEYIDFTQRASFYLSGGISEDKRQPDRKLVAQPFSATVDESGSGETWNDPFVRRN